MRILLFCSLLAATATYALARGGRSERAIALVLVAGTAATMAVMSLGIDNYRSTRWGVAAVDAAMLAGLGWISVRHGARSASWIAAIQLIVVLAHPVRAWSPWTINFVYYGLTAWLMYPQLAILAAATYRARRRTRRSSPGC